jgi:hypothetical protein
MLMKTTLSRISNDSIMFQAQCEVFKYFVEQNSYISVGTSIDELRFALSSIRGVGLLCP